MRPSRSSSYRSPPFRFLSVTATDFITMPSRHPYGGGWNQWHRGLSEGNSGGSGDIVTGDSHYSSVREANLGIRQGERGGFRPRQFNPRPRFYQNQDFNPRPQFNQNQDFNPRQPFHQNQPFNSRPQYYQSRNFNPRLQFQQDRNLNPRSGFDPNQPYNQRQSWQQNQHFRQPQPLRPQPPRPSDYRQWEFTRPGPPPHCERFTILSYNILAEYLANDHRNKLYYHIPRHMLDWEWRKRNLIFELGLWSADIMCFQEVDRFHDLEEELKLRGYSGIWKMRTGNPVDGCAIFWRASRFKLLHEESIEFNKLQLRDNVAQICVLESMRTQKEENTSELQASSTVSNRVVICNIHVLYNPKRGEIKLGQVRLLLDKAHAVSQIWNNAPIALCGDFNCTPKSPLYNYISEQKLDLSELPRDKVSGQASAEIRAPWQFRPNSRPQFANNPVQFSAGICGTNTGIQQNESSSNTERQNVPSRGVENVSSTNNVYELHSGDTMLDVSDKSCTEGNNGIESGVRTDEMQDVENGNNNEMDLVGDDPSEGSRRSASHAEGEFNIHNSSSVDDKSIPSIASDSEGIHSNATLYSDCESSGELSRSNIYKANGSTECDESRPFEGDGYFTEVGFNLDPVNYSSDQLTGTSIPNNVEVCASAMEDFSCQSTENDFKVGSSPQCKHASTKVVIAMTEDLAINEQDGNLGEDCDTFLTELTGDGFPPDIIQLKDSSSQSESLDDISPDTEFWPIDGEKSIYDPSSWTPAEIETATGNADCTILEHPLKLKSTYTEVENLSETRDLNGEPLATSYNRCFLGTVDYIWRSEGLQTVRVLAPIPKPAMQWTQGFPTKKWGSDHIALASELAFLNNVADRNTGQ